MGNAPAFSINGHSIPGSFYGRVLKFCGGDRERAARIFLRAEFKKAADPVKWISAGMVKNGYAWNACRLETDNPRAAREWIDKNIFQISPEKFSDVMIDALDDMVSTMKAARERKGKIICTTGN